MRHFITGIIIGSALTASVGMAASSLYDSHGAVAAPRGSVESFDYYRQRQLFIDASHTRDNVDTLTRSGQLNPCQK